MVACVGGSLALRPTLAAPFLAENRATTLHVEIYAATLSRPIAESFLQHCRKSRIIYVPSRLHYTAMQRCSGSPRCETTASALSMTSRDLHVEIDFCRR